MNHREAPPSAWLSPDEHKLLGDCPNGHANPIEGSHSGCLDCKALCEQEKAYFEKLDRLKAAHEKEKAAAEGSADVDVRHAA